MVRFRRVLAPFLLGLVVGCSPFAPYGSGSGCAPPPPATDASSPGISLECHRPPCGFGTEAVRGSDPHLAVVFQCPGESDPFLAAVKIDGKLFFMRDVAGAGYGSEFWFDAGSWEPPDTLWHDVEVVLDPLNLFKETDESNNRGTTRLRIVEPDMALDVAAFGFTVPPEAGGDTTASAAPAPARPPSRPRVGGGS
jgi:hypothetical protein